jgi:hypothetical protein
MGPIADVPTATSVAPYGINETAPTLQSSGIACEFVRGPSFVCFEARLNKPSLGCVFSCESKVEANLTLFELVHRARRVHKLVVFDRASLNEALMTGVWGLKATKKLLVRVVALNEAFLEMFDEKPSALNEIEPRLPHVARNSLRGSGPHEVGIRLLVRGFNFYREWLEDGGKAMRTLL